MSAVLPPLKITWKKMEKNIPAALNNVFLALKRFL